MTQNDIVQHYVSKGAILFEQSNSGPTTTRTGNRYAKSFWAGYDGHSNPYLQHDLWYYTGAKLKSDGR